MKFLFKIGTFFIGLLLICLCVSIIPMHFVPKKLVSSIGIVPQSISEYGYVNILKRQFEVRDFSMISSIDTESYGVIKADKIGVSMISGMNLSLNKCELYIVTTHLPSDISKFILGKISAQKNVNLDLSNCILDIKKVSNSELQKLKGLKDISENDILNSVSDLNLHIENFDLSAYKNQFLGRYNLSGEIGGRGFDISFEDSANSLKIKGDIDGSSLDLETNNGFVNFSFKSRDFNSFIKQYYCSSASCLQIASKILPQNIKIDFTMKNELWSGKITGDVDGVINEKNDSIDINFNTWSTVKGKKDEQNSDIKSGLISIFDFVPMNFTPRPFSTAPTPRIPSGLNGHLPCGSGPFLGGGPNRSPPDNPPFLNCHPW